jgi:hypothetical protein
VFTDQEKDSASKSIIALGQYIGPLQEEYNREVVFKISIGFTPEQLEIHMTPQIRRRINSIKSLQYENCVYSNIHRIQSAELNCVLPVHTFNYVGQNDYAIYGYLDSLADNRDLQESFRALIRTVRDYEPVLDPRTVQIKITEKTPGAITLADFLTTNMNRLTTRILSGIIIQVLCSLVLLREAGLRHNDMHMSNVLIAPGTYFTGTYQVGRQLFNVDLAEGKILMFDWDFSSAPNFCGDNERLTDHCMDHGVCSSGSLKYDVILFFYAMYKQLRVIDRFESWPVVAEFNRFFNLNFDSRLRVDDFSPGCNRSKCGRIRSTVTPDFPAAIPSIEEIAMLDYFRPIRA